MFFADWMPEGWAIVIGALGLFLGQLASFIANMVTLARQKTAAVDRKEISTKLEVMDKDQKVIHTLVNSQAEKLSTAIANTARSEGKLAGMAEERANPMSPTPPVVVVPPIPIPLHVVVDMPKLGGDK